LQVGHDVSRAIDCAIDYWHALIVIVIPRGAAKGLSDIENLAVAARGTCCSTAWQKADPPGRINFCDTLCSFAAA
jgi:hypothetical protein